MTCCNTFKVLSFSEDTNSLTANIVFWGPKILPDTRVKLLSFHSATLTPTIKSKMFSYLNIIWSITLHSRFFWQPNTTIFQGSENCSRHLLVRSRGDRKCYCWTIWSICMADTGETFAWLRSVALSHISTLATGFKAGFQMTKCNSFKILKRNKSVRFGFCYWKKKTKNNNSHCHSPSILKTGQKDAEPAVFLQLLLWVLIQDGPKKRAQSFVLTKKEVASKDFSWDNGRRTAKSLEFQPTSQGSQ